MKKWRKKLGRHRISARHGKIKSCPLRLSGVMDATWTKLTCTGLIVTLSCVFGFLPLLFANKLKGLDPR